MQKRSPHTPGIGLDTAAIPPDLRPFVQAMVERRDADTAGEAIELPDTSALLQFVIGPDYEMRPRGGGSAYQPVPRAALWGPTSTVWDARVAGPVHIYCVVLTHAGAAALAKAPVADVVERRICTRDLGVRDDDVVARLEAAPSFAARTTIVVHWLRAAFAGAGSHDRDRLALADAIAQGRVSGTVEQIARDIGVSARGLHKRIRAVSGWAPKQVLRLARLQAVLRQIHPEPWDDPLAYDALLQFHDQAHFARDFKSLTGLTPSDYKGAKRLTGDRLINTLYLA